MEAGEDEREDEPEVYNPVRDEARVMRERLARMGRNATPAQRDAAALLAAHGDEALLVFLGRSERNPRVRALLEMAGCSAQVEMFRVDRSRVEVEDPLPF